MGPRRELCAVSPRRPACGRLYKGTLGDGTKISQKTLLSKNGQWPFYNSIYKGSGSVLCWVTFTNSGIKEFSGGIAIQPAKAPTTFLEKLLGNKSEEHMSAIGKQAHELAKVLNKYMGFEAYVLHTPTSSIVTVGAYADSEDEKLHQAQKQLRNMQFGWIQLASNRDLLSGGHNSDAARQAFAAEIHDVLVRLRAIQQLDRAKRLDTSVPPGD